MSKRIAGTCYFKADGESFNLRGSFTVSPDPYEREGVAGLDGVHGYTETQRVPYIEGEISDHADLSLKKIREMRDVTITAELANGKTYVLRNAWAASARDLNAGEGSMTLRFEGLECEEI